MKPRHTTISTMDAKQRKRAAELCRTLPLIQHELFTLGLTITSAHMAKTIEKLGYECCLADLKAGRLTPHAAKREAWMKANGQEKELERDRKEALRGAERMLYGKAA